MSRVTLTQKEVQEILFQLRCCPADERFSKCLDILVERKGEYSHKVAHDLVRRASQPTRGATARKISHEEAVRLRNTVVYSY